MQISRSCLSFASRYQYDLEQITSILSISVLSSFKNKLCNFFSSRYYDSFIQKLLGCLCVQCGARLPAWTNLENWEKNQTCLKNNFSPFSFSFFLSLDCYINNESQLQINRIQSLWPKDRNLAVVSPPHLMSL